ncbi:MAG: cupin domain-containing protein [Gemmatimonadaceae bacterium]
MKNAENRSRREVVGAFAALITSGVLSARVASALEPGAPARADEISAKLLFEKELAGHAGEQVSMTVVSYPPGLESQAHSHHGPVFVYVIEGTMELQVLGGPITTVQAGETFYEAPGGVHAVSRNASKTKPAKLIAFIVGKQGTPITGPPLKN